MADIFREHVLLVLVGKHNEYSRKAAYWKRLEHPEWDKYAAASIAILECVRDSFQPCAYRFEDVTETICGYKFTWRCMEVV